MVWEEKLSIGVDAIDEQHRELFAKVGVLLNEVNGSVEESKEKCIATILFLKDYAVNHFETEESYQKMIGYPAFEEHKKLHAKFVQNVLEHEKKMTASNFAEKDVKAFTGMLVAWLIFHVANADREIGTFIRKMKQEKRKAVSSYHEIVQASVFDVLSKMTGLEVKDMKEVETSNESMDGSVAVDVGITHDISGFVTIIYPLVFIKNLTNKIMGFMPEMIDELEISALFEVSNIMSGAICGLIGSEKGIVCDVMPPQLSKSPENIPAEEKIYLDTGIGVIEAAILLC